MHRPWARLIQSIPIGWDGMDWIDLAQDRDQWEGSCEHGNEPSGSIKCWEVLEWLHNWRILKKGSAPWVSDRPSIGEKPNYWDHHAFCWSLMNFKRWKNTLGDEALTQTFCTYVISQLQGRNLLYQGWTVLEFENGIHGWRLLSSEMWEISAFQRSLLPPPSAPDVDTAGSSKTLVPFYQTTHCHPENSSKAG
jgi:hypothetical protein